MHVNLVLYFSYSTVLSKKLKTLKKTFSYIIIHVIHEQKFTNRKVNQIFLKLLGFMENENFNLF